MDKKENKITARVFKNLYRPSLGSDKKTNGRLLVVAGSERYHGSLLYALKAAARVAGLVYFLTTPENRETVRRLRGKTAAFIPVEKIKEAPADVILIGPGLGLGKRTRRLVREALDSKKRAVLDADALNVLDDSLKKKLSEIHILTPHEGEFRRLFGQEPTAVNLSSAARTYHCHIVLKGEEYRIASPDGRLASGKLSVPGASKGGAGDILAGLIAALYCRNEADLAAAAACFALDKAAAGLYKDRKEFFSSEDLGEQLPLALGRLVKNR